MMDRQRINTALKSFLDTYCQARYQGVVITVDTERDLAQVKTQVEALLLDRDVWTSPGVDCSPSIPCSRREYNETVLSKRQRGLVIVSPFDWMFDWPEQDQVTFWTGVADSFGRHSILILAVGTPLIIRQLRISFSRHSLPGLSISVWLSKHQTTDGLEEVLS
jgi:hypothetical protein